AEAWNVRHQWNWWSQRRCRNRIQSVQAQSQACPSGLEIANLNHAHRLVSIDAIRAKLAWVNATPDPNKCGCRNVRCCKETGHQPGACSGSVATKFWTFRWEYYCAPCREYGWCGGKARGYMTARLVVPVNSNPRGYCFWWVLN